jgi:hypothetical protein
MFRYKSSSNTSKKHTVLKLKALLINQRMTIPFPLFVHVMFVHIDDMYVCLVGCCLNVSTLYASYKKKNMSLAMTALIKKTCDKEVDAKESYLLLEVMAADDKGEPIDLPIVRFKYK